MKFKRNNQLVPSVVGAIAATTLLGIATIFPQAAFSQSSGDTNNAPMPSGMDVPSGTEGNDPNRPDAIRNDPRTPANSAPTQQQSDEPYRAPASTNRSSEPTSGDRTDGTMNPNSNTSTQETNSSVSNRNNLSEPSDDLPKNRVERYTQTGVRNADNERLTSLDRSSTSYETNMGNQNDLSEPSNDLPRNRIERYTQPGATNPSNFSSERSTSLGTVSSPDSNRAENRNNLDAPNTAQPSNRIEQYTQSDTTDPRNAPSPDVNRSTSPTPNSDTNNTGVGGTSPDASTGEGNPVPGMW